MAELELRQSEHAFECQEQQQKMQAKLEDARKDVQLLESQLDRKDKVLSQSLKKLEAANKRVVELENQNSKFDDELRFKGALVQDLQARLETTLEQLAILQLEAEHIREASQEDKQRLKARLEELQEDLNVKKRPKHLRSVEW